jgi:phage terminase small subunit
MKNKLSTQQKRFADGVLSGLHAGRAYEAAGYNSTGSTADVCASQLLRKPKVSEYIENIKTKATSDLVMSIKERKEWLTGGIKVPLSEVDSSSTYCVEEINTEGMTKIKKVDPIRAMDMLNKMDGAYAAEKVEVEHKGGVLVVPMAEDLDEWEKNSIEQQEKLQQETIDI